MVTLKQDQILLLIQQKTKCHQMQKISLIVIKVIQEVGTLAITKHLTKEPSLKQHSIHKAKKILKHLLELILIEVQKIRLHN